MVVATGGVPILELATRAKTELILIIVEPEEGEYEGWYQKMFRNDYEEIQLMIKAASDRGLVDVEVIKER